MHSQVQVAASSYQYRYVERTALIEPVSCPSPVGTGAGSLVKLDHTGDRPG